MENFKLFKLDPDTCEEHRSIRRSAVVQRLNMQCSVDPVSQRKRIQITVRCMDSQATQISAAFAQWESRAVVELSHHKVPASSQRPMPMPFCASEKNMEKPVVE